MGPWHSIIRILAVVLTAAAMVGAPSVARAERWSGSGEVCLDLDSVHITNKDGTRYVTFRQQLCKGSEILLWAVADSDCGKLHGKDASTVDLYVYDADARQWRTVYEYFNFPPPLENLYTNAGVACNWVHSGFL
ncbi:MAG: hypothetical protein KGL11_02405 [Alphaproteobacteria bacterium]|nr:hypothetical protein [Alphaproteobacteria bacterium]